MPASGDAQNDRTLASSSVKDLAVGSLADAQRSARAAHAAVRAMAGASGGRLAAETALRRAEAEDGE